MNTNIKFPKTFVVTGTDTGVGKTVISTLLLNLLQGSYWKPIQAGTDTETDTHFVKTNSFVPDTHLLKEGYLLSRPLSPALAAKLDGVEIDLNALKIPPHAYSPLIIEGVGGVMSPLNEKELFIDLLKKWGLPVLIVARSTLGTINHTLMTLKVLSDYRIDVIGVMLNGPKNQANRDSIEHLGRVQVIGEMTPVDNLKEVCRTLYASKV